MPRETRGTQTGCRQPLWPANDERHERNYRACWPKHSAWKRPAASRALAHGPFAEERGWRRAGAAGESLHVPGEEGRAVGGCFAAPGRRRDGPGGACQARGYLSPPAAAPGGRPGGRHRPRHRPALPSMLCLH